VIVKGTETVTGRGTGTVVVMRTMSEAVAEETTAGNGQGTAIASGAVEGMAVSTTAERKSSTLERCPADELVQGPERRAQDIEGTVTITL